MSCDIKDAFLYDILLSSISETLESAEGSNVRKVLGSIYKLHDEREGGGFYSPRRVFLIGAGRSKLVAKMFAMRLMHIDIEAYVVGDVTTPRIKSGDLLIGISNSGNTQSVANICSNVRRGENRSLVKLLAITGNNLSQLACIADDVVVINGDGFKKEITPLGTLFELSTLILLEAVIGYMIMENELTEESLALNHTNLE